MEISLWANSNPFPPLFIEWLNDEKNGKGNTYINGVMTKEKWSNGKKTL